MSKPICVISGPFNRSGYGDWATAVAKSLIRYDKFDIKVVPQKWGNCQSKRFLEELTDPEDVFLSTKLLNEQLKSQPDLFIQLTIPNEFQPIGKYNIGMTAGIETDICSGEFIEGINRIDLTIALSKHAKDVFLNTKMIKQHPDGRKEPLTINKPIEICFWGADTNIFKKTEEISDSVNQAFDKIPEDFAFLFVGQWTAPGIYNDRKDIGNLIKTFCETFNYNSPKKPCLIIKTSGVGFSTVDRFELLNSINKIKSSIKGQCPNVYLLHGELNEVEMNSLYNHPKVKCHVSFTHGEGYGHPMLLQTLSGKPLLAPNWSGHLDFLNPEYANLLPGTMAQVNKNSLNPWTPKESKWFKVSYNLAREKLKSMYIGYPNERVLENAEKLRKENEEKFSMTAMDKKLWSILDQYVPKFSKENQFVLPKLKLSSENFVDNKGQIKLPKLKMPDDISLSENENKIKLPKLKTL